MLYFNQPVTTAIPDTSDIFQKIVIIKKCKSKQMDILRCAMILTLTLILILTLVTCFWCCGSIVRFSFSRLLVQLPSLHTGDLRRNQRLTCGRVKLALICMSVVAGSNLPRGLMG